MKELKFRAWQEKHKKMVYGDILFINGVSDGGTCSLNTTLSNLQQEYSLMQYTGLKDKNGAEIYEGDVVKDSKGVGIVGYAPPMFVVQSENDYYTLGGGDIYPNNSQLTDTEVIGNAHQNPELINS